MPVLFPVLSPKMTVPSPEKVVWLVPPEDTSEPVMFKVAPAETEAEARMMLEFESFTVPVLGRFIPPALTGPENSKVVPDAASIFPEPLKVRPLEITWLEVLLKVPELRATPLEEDPRAASLETMRLPPETVTSPLKVLEPLKINVPSPVLFKPTVPPMVAEMVAVSEALVTETMLPEALGLRVSVWFPLLAIV